MSRTLTLDLTLHSRQLEALHTDATELLFGGATRGGKSHFIRCALIGWCLAVPQLACTLIRKKYQDILDNHVFGLNGFRDLLRPLIDAGFASVTREHVSFQNGSRIAFKHCQDERQLETAQGVSSNVLVIDEATQISERLLKTFRAWCTMPEEMKRSLPPELQGKFPRVIYTANPIGVSVGYFRRRFVKARPTGSIEKVDGFKRQYLPSRVADNPSEDPEATRGRVEGLHDSATARALLEGDWDAPVGEFFPEWDEDKHVVPDFIPPLHWLRFRTHDWGTAEPACTHWWAVSDGEGFNDGDGKRRWYPRGALICYREWYCCDAESPAVGNRMRNEELAVGILERSPLPCEKRVPTLSDSLPFQDRGGVTIAETYANCGVLLTLGDTSRVPGWSQMRSRLKGIRIDSNDAERTPLIYFVESCTFARDYIPALPRHPLEKKKEDAAEDGEATHACDCVRLACMARARPIDAEAPPPDTAHAKGVTGQTFDQAFTRHVEKKQRARDAGW